MHAISPEELEITPDTRPVWRREYDTIMARFDEIDTKLAGVPDMVAYCKAAADDSLKAHRLAQTALWMRSSWAPYIVSAVTFAMSFTALVLAVIVYGLVRR